MPQVEVSRLAAWESFYVILGSAAAVLAGLVFLAVTLIPVPDPRGQRSSQAVEAALGGTVYTLITMRRLRGSGSYQPLLEDWVWYAVTPLVAYAALIVVAVLLPGTPRRALFGVGALLLLLLVLGLRNGWDMLTYTVLLRLPRNEAGDEQRPSSAGATEAAWPATPEGGSDTGENHSR